MPTVHYIPMKGDKYRDQSVSIMNDLSKQLMNIDCEDIQTLEIREIPCISGSRKGYYDTKENILYVTLREQNKTDRFYDKNYILSQAIHGLAHKSEERHKDSFVSLLGQYTKNIRQNDPTFKATYQKEECIYHHDGSNINYVDDVKAKVQKWYSKVEKSTGEDATSESETSHHASHHHHHSPENRNNEAPENIMEPNPKQAKESVLDSNKESNSNDSDEELDERTKAIKQQQLKKEQQKAILKQQNFSFNTNLSNTIVDPYTSGNNLQLPNANVPPLNYIQNNDLLHNAPPIGIQPMLKQPIPYKNPFISDTIKLESSPDCFVFRDYYNPFDKDSMNPFINEETKQDANVDIENEINSISRDYRNIFVVGSVTPEFKPTTNIPEFKPITNIPEFKPITNIPELNHNDHEPFVFSNPPQPVSSMAEGLYDDSNRTKGNNSSQTANEHNITSPQRNDDDDEPRPPIISEFPSLFPPQL